MQRHGFPDNGEARWTPQRALTVQDGGDEDAISEAQKIADTLSLFVDRKKEADLISAGALESLQRGPEVFMRAPWQALATLLDPIPDGSFVVLAGRSGHGKTTLMISWFDALVTNNYATMYAGTEMSAKRLKIHWACRRLAARGIHLHPGDVLTGKLHPESPERIENWLQLTHSLQQEIAAMEPLFEMGRLVPVPFLNANVIRRLAQQAKAWGVRAIFLDHLDHIDADESSGSDTSEHNKILKAIHSAAQKYEVTFLGAAQLKQNAHPDPMRKYRPLTEDMVRFGMLKRQISDMMICTYRPLPIAPHDPEGLRRYRQAIRALRDDDTNIERYLIPNTMGVGLMKDREYGKIGKHCYLGVYLGRITDANQHDQFAAEKALLELGDD